MRNKFAGCALAVLVSVARSDYTKSTAPIELPSEQPWRKGATAIPGVKDYDGYMRAQLHKFDSSTDKFKKADGSPDHEAMRQFYEGGRIFHTKGGVSRDSIKFVANWLTAHLPMRNKFALCHGSNMGFEMAYFREALPESEVWGTELAPKTAKMANWTLNWDFHVVKPEWRGRADFVYSNALDHSPDPALAVTRWMEEVAPGGAVVIEWSRFQIRGGKALSKTDLFGGSYYRLFKVLTQAAVKSGTFVVRGAFNNSGVYDKHSFSYRLWHVLQHQPAGSKCPGGTIESCTTS